MKIIKIKKRHTQEFSPACRKVVITTKIKCISSVLVQLLKATVCCKRWTDAKKKITVEEIRKMQGLTELLSDPFRRQEPQNPRTLFCNLTIKTKTTIDDHPQVSNGITPWNFLRTQEQTRQHHVQQNLKSELPTHS
jgi:hypothetical protein